MLWTDKIESERGDKLTTTFIKYVNKDKILELVIILIKKIGVMGWEAR